MPMGSPMAVTTARRCRTRPRSRSTRWLPAGLLVVAALVQSARIHLLDASSWGGGPAFAMFADIDHAGTRFVRIHVDRGHGWRPHPVPPVADDRILRLRHLPSDGGAAALAATLLDSDHLTPSSGERVDGVRVELWTTDIADGHLVASRLATGEARR